MTSGGSAEWRPACLDKPWLHTSHLGKGPLHLCFLVCKTGTHGVPVWHDGLKIESMHVKSESSTRPKPHERARWRRTALPPLPPAFTEASGAPGHAVLCVASCITFVHPLSKQMGSVPVGTPDSQRNHFEKRRFSDGPCC